MTLREALKKHTRFVMFCGTCECGEAKYDLIVDDDLAYPPVHESTILEVNPELLGGQNENN
ncbi:TPA: hypothetical protein U0U57_002164 [Listeria monocytogenes]|uniref:hypothetical protein n=1 Tax=Listeria monocytogenes TaxID=1639 RepID=UPI000BE0E097|nr:hypothetical protein [Listeria monocytogenes]EAE3702087.1 hypothetical protein [Listeria monocytogenes serotype 1/2c]EAD3838203.1 hypothetical protein [Listeria monocytogenes]EAF3421698.1 hypothetical protein [Listeria monocytogenes]EBB5865003.1 hypothetical protein [Listeria monocytogenes]PDM04170.1 hypothetical protein CDR96_00350 [Listeria monocytogenes]